MTVQLTFSDGTTKTVTAPVKKFADGNAQYAGTAPASSSMSMPVDRRLDDGACLRPPPGPGP